MNTKALRQTPIRKPVHALPGESVRGDLEDLLFGNMMAWALGAVMVVVLASMDWVRWYFETPLSPVTTTVFAVLFVLYAAIRVRVAWPKVRALKMALRGEVAVGQFLEEQLGVFSGRVFHDIPIKSGDRVIANIDHVAICSKGILVVETKTWSKSQNDKIVFDGKAIFVNGTLEPDRNPVDQAKSNARWIRDLLEELTGHRFLTRPVVLFPGWYVEGSSREKSARKPDDVWVLSAKALPAFLEHEADQFDEQQVKMISGQLSRDLRRGRRL